jgi:hypothetical protein
MTRRPRNDIQCLLQQITARKIYCDYLSQLPCKNELSEAIPDNSRSQHYDFTNAYAVLPKGNFTVPCHMVQPSHFISQQLH